MIIVDDMKKIYCARSREEATEAFLLFKEIWHTKYPMVVARWERKLPCFAKYFSEG